MSTLLAIAAAAMAAWIACVMFASRELVRLRCYGKHASVFFERSEVLLRDPEVPSSALDLIAFITMFIDDRNGAKILAMALATPRKNGGPEPEWAEFFRRRHELFPVFSEALGAGLSAITYRSRFWGWVVRRQIAALITNREAAPAIVRAFRNKADQKHPLDGAGLAAPA